MRIFTQVVEIYIFSYSISVLPTADAILLTDIDVFFFFCFWSRTAPHVSVSLFVPYDIFVHITIKFPLLL